jgi:parvulin-like peptidyl-prolyl isomerase
MSKKPSPPSSPYLNRRLVSRHAREDKFRRQLVWGTGILLGVVAILLAWGLYDHYGLQPRRPVATVAGTPITLKTYQKQVNYRRWDYDNYLNQLQAQRQQFAAGGEDQAFLVQYMDQQIQQAQSMMANLPTTVLDQLIDDQITRQECEVRGISVTADEVQLDLETQFGYDRNPPTATPTPITHTLPITVTPTATIAPMTQEEFDTNRTQWATAMKQGTGGYSEDEFRTLVESTLLRQKLEDALTADMPTTGDQVHARHILVATAEEAQAVLDRLNAGEEWDALAAELSQDTSNMDNGGDLGWFSTGQMDPAFDQAAFALQPGETSGAVETQFGFHIIRVDERDANHPLDDNALATARQALIDEWYTARRASPDVVRSWSSTMIPTVVPTRMPQR